MYVPAHFEENDPEAIHALIEEHPLGTFVTLGPDGINANHIPFELDPRPGEHGSLIGHVARNNTVWREVQSDPEAESLVIFQGPTAYVSPNWYATKAETHQVVPTYNYAVAHVYGTVTVHDDVKWLRGQAGRLTKRMERDQPAPWKMADAPSAYVQDMLEQIVGIELHINRVVGKWKVSQNRADTDRAGAAAGLRERRNHDDLAIADLIERYLS